MQTRATKVFLPQNYEEYLAQKKKMTRLLTNKHSFSHNDTFSNPQQKEHNANQFAGSSGQTYRSNNPSIHNGATPKSLLFQNNFLNPSTLQKSKNNRSSAMEQIEANSDNEDESKNTNKKEVQIVEKVVYSEYKNLFEEFQNNKFDAIRRKIQLELERLKEDTPLQPLKVNQILKKIELQSLQNITELQKELSYPFNKRNAQKLDNMLSFNKFFVILNKEKRFRIYQNCLLKKLAPNEIVYREGELNEHMYVVLKGCIKQYETKSTSYQQKVEVNFVSYYEGSNFGQAPLVGDSQLKGKRYNTTVATEESYLLQLTNNFYKELITNSAEDDFEKKIHALMETTIFRDTSKMFVTPLLPTLTKHVLPYGTVLIRQGQEVRQLYFVAEGNLDVMLLDRARRNVKHLNIEEKPKNFYIKKSEPKSQKQKSFSIHTKFYYPQNTQNQQKQFLYGNKKIVSETELQYNEQIIFQTLRIGDFLGGKSFLQEIEREKKMMNSEFFDTSLRAKLSVLSSSPKAVVYSIDEKKFFSLSDNFQKMIVEGIMEAKYFDEENIQVKVQEQKDWKKFAEKLVSNVIVSKKNNRSTSFRI